jgi:agmatinase
VAASHVAYELVTLMADNAVEGNRFGADTGYAAQALGQEVRRPAGFSASSPLSEPDDAAISRQAAGALK